MSLRELVDDYVKKQRRQQRNTPAWKAQVRQLCYEITEVRDSDSEQRLINRLEALFTE